MIRKFAPVRRHLCLVAALVLGLAGPAAAQQPRDPALGLGLAGIADWATQQPFLDLMKSSRPWIGHLPGQWGGWDAERLRAEGHVDAEGWVTSIPPELDRIETLVLTDQPAEAGSLAGRYLLRYRGKGEISVGGLARDVRRGPNEIRFSYTPGPGLVSVALHRLDPDDPIRDIVILREDRLPLHQAGVLFNPDWIARIADLRGLRFMDWMATNGSRQVSWDDRPRPEDARWDQGVPVEVMLALANEINADPWFTLPHMADDGYVARFAQAVHDGLDPRLVVQAEWSNEVWNFVFPQAHWARERAIARWGAAAEADGWMQYAGLRAAEVADIWAGVFADAPDRLQRVIATHTGWPGLENPLLDAPLAVAEGRAAPWSSFDGYAVTGYFGLELGGDEIAPELRRWIADGSAEDRATVLLRDGSFADLTGRLWPHHAAVAGDRGLRLMMYEGGTHVTGHGAQTEDAALTGFFTDFNYSAGMAQLYDDMFTAWRDVGGTVFTGYSDVIAPSKWGSWGSLRHLDDTNPRWDALMRINATAAGWDDRAPGSFAQGVTRHGSAGPDEISGTAEEDTLLAGDGDDLLRAGFGDRLHGGAGHDRARLPGRRADWPVSRDGDRLRLGQGRGAVTLFAIEELVFDDAPDEVIAVEDLQ